MKDFQFTNLTDASTNAGLWFDKFIANQNAEGDEKGAEKSKQILIDETCLIALPEVYKPFFERWKKDLCAAGAQVKTLKLTGRMAIGLGAESVAETAIALHKVYGVPYISGSSLKGMAASYADKYIEGFEKNGESYNFVFGATDKAGFITFHDALLIPQDTPFLHREIMTVHHPDYYGDNPQPPADWDSPQPIPFLSASGSYLLALSASHGAESWREGVFQIINLALQNEGIGAKTSSGFGRGFVEKSTEEIADEQNKGKVETFINGVNKFRQTEVPGQIGNKVTEWRKLDVSQNLKIQAAQAILEKVNKDWKNGKQKDWYQELLNFVEGEN